MKLVVDANAFVSALLRDGLSRRLLFHPELELLAPSSLLGEVIKHSQELRGKFKGDEGEFQRLFRLLASGVSFISINELKPYVVPASVLSHDRDDWIYLACCLYADASLWSNDNDFRQQRRVRVFSTSQLARRLGQLL